MLLSSGPLSSVPVAGVPGVVYLASLAESGLALDAVVSTATITATVLEAAAASDATAATGIFVAGLVDAGGAADTITAVAVIGVALAAAAGAGDQFHTFTRVPGGTWIETARPITWVETARSITWTIGSRGQMSYIPKKTGERRNLTIDFSEQPEIVAGDTINQINSIVAATRDGSAATPLALGATAIVNSGQGVSVVVSAGQDQVPYLVTVLVTTAGGIILEGIMPVLVADDITGTARP